MYNLTVADVHTFVVGEGAWVVHNQELPAHGNHREGPQIVYEITRTNNQTGVTEVWKYGIGHQYNTKQRAGDWILVENTYNKGGQPEIRGDRYLDGPVTTINPDMNLNWKRPEGQVRKLNKSGGSYTYDWRLMAVTDTLSDGRLVEQFYVSRHVQVHGQYPEGQNEKPKIFEEYDRYLNSGSC